MFSTGNIKTPGTVWTELDQVLLDPLHNSLLVLPPLASLSRHPVQQAVEAHYQPVRLGCVPVNALRSYL